MYLDETMTLILLLKCILAFTRLLVSWSD